ncbi:PTS sugar transporter subunit IIB [Oceanobacillus jeddahense]|uniref:PTS sugar transporter subunit IIB n=1 Tax=Oceanobacillus jeddahense TaxID=1462527 RepID=UPI000595E182|nr:PTS sugar transporter subunit IIB [Oceanobacillus jeddahense]
MKKIVIACGAGIATSSMVKGKVEELVEGIPCEVVQTTFNELAGYDDNADLFITTMKTNENFKTPVVQGSAFLTGINEEQVEEEILAILKQ